MPSRAERVSNGAGRGQAPRPWIAGAVALLLASCAGGPHHMQSAGNSRPHRPSGPVSDTPVKVGRPYQVQGRWYYPADIRDYDEVGLASWYGPGFHTGATANGEYYDSNWISAAHKTLPLPCYVEVTALDTGRTILVRINDRGPFVADRVIDLSLGAARLLGIERKGLSRVRVRRVEPSANDRLALRTGKPAVMRPNASPSELASLNARLNARPAILATAASAATPSYRPAPVPTRQPVMPPAVIPYAPMPAGPAAASASVSPVPPLPMATASLFVQVAVLSDQARAEGLATALSVYGSSRIEPTGPLWRVRMGPYIDESSAEAALARIQGQGYQDARIVRN
ncbi:septal ring lytic transglycosylase RlpA family protein [Flavisphingomonas formosensis]|uniref:septal ring lytic transglycosylase RlpA family protein n=1 Tax=Flavisphingomonas formosensis TaxID=861534 RepID=UPI0012F8D00F|nr:septal ring lytic transglycosylase RlpA family protein [Sphingomonas formosensis]